jgi:GT2 family glycosyltransferase
MEVSIIIVNYNTKKQLQECLISIYERTKFLSFEIIVLDNASTDGSPEMINTNFPKVKVIQGETNLGFGQANNKAALAAKGKYLFFLNPDTLLINNAIYILYRFISRHSEATVCGGNLYTSTLKPALSFSQTMPGITADIDYFFGNFFSRIKYGRSLHFNYNKMPLRLEGFSSGANLMVHKNVFLDNEGFDPDFFMYYEETELIYRLKNKNHQVFSIPRAKIIHLEGTSEPIKRNAALRNYHSKYTYYNKTKQGNAIFISHQIFVLTAWQRIFLFSLMGKKKKVHIWLNLLKWEREAYHKFK